MILLFRLRLRLEGRRIGGFGIPGFSLSNLFFDYQDGAFGVEPFTVFCDSVVLLRVPFVRRKR